MEQLKYQTMEIPEELLKLFGRPLPIHSKKPVTGYIIATVLILIGGGLIINYIINKSSDV
jgi:hypothetical protein